jgi:predicted MFS family arabinose efflux permease
VISDYFPPNRRGTGLAIYSLGVPIGSALGIALGGWIAVHHGWRAAFVVVGLPGLALALLMPLLVREPRRGRLDPHAGDVADHAAPPSLMQVIATLARNRTLRIVALSSGLSAFVGYAMLSWNPSFLERIKGMSLGEVAHWYSLVLGLTGIVGTFGAGRMVDRLGRRDPRWYGWVPAIAFALGLPAFLGLLWAPDWRWAMGFLTVLGLLSNMYLAPALAVVQNVAHPSQRTVAGAALLFVLNLIGLGGGPVFVGLVSDLATAHHAAHPLLVGYWALVPIILVTIACHLRAAASMGRDDDRG